jgi:hypothetical protein
VLIFVVRISLCQVVKNLPRLPVVAVYYNEHLHHHHRQLAVPSICNRYLEMNRNKIKK